MTRQYQAAFLGDLIHRLEEIRADECANHCPHNPLAPHSLTCSEITAIILDLAERLADLD